MVIRAELNSRKQDFVCWTPLAALENSHLSSVLPAIAIEHCVFCIRIIHQWKAQRVSYPVWYDTFSTDHIWPPRGWPVLKGWIYCKKAYNIVSFLTVRVPRHYVFCIHNLCVHERRLCRNSYYGSSGCLSDQVQSVVRTCVQQITMYIVLCTKQPHPRPSRRRVPYDYRTPLECRGANDSNEVRYSNRGSHT